MDALDLLSGTVRVDSDVVVTVVGEVDLLTAPSLRTLLDEALVVGAGTVTLDLAGVTFMDAQGLTVLVSAARQLREAGRRLTVRGARASPRRLFDVTGLAGFLGVDAATRAPTVVHTLALAAALPLTRELLDAALTTVVRMTQAVVSGADGASITVPRQGQLRTVAASNNVVRDMDTDQYETGEGPCLDAATQGERFHIGSLDTERRWPAFVPRARARGIRSILSTPLLCENSALGALNIYSRSVDAFAQHEQEWADTFAAEAASLVTHAYASPTALDLDEQLQHALQSREVIALAQGITMGRVGGTPAEAYLVLRDVSVRTGQPLFEVCARIVANQTAHRAARSSGGEYEPVHA